MAIGAGKGSGGGGGSSAIKAGEAFIEIYANDISVRKTLAYTVDSIKAVGARLRQIGVASIAAGTAILAPIVASFIGAVEQATSINKLATALNATSEGTSALAYAAKQSGIELEDLRQIAFKLNKAVLDANEGATAQATAFAQMDAAAGKAGKAYDELATKADKAFNRDALNELNKALEQWPKEAANVKLTLKAPKLITPDLKKLFTDDNGDIAPVIDVTVDKKGLKALRDEYASTLGEVAAKTSDVSNQIKQLPSDKNVKVAVKVDGGNDLKTLGQTARDFAKLDIDQKFIRIAETLDTMTDPIQKTRFLFGLFGEDANKILPLVGKGAAKLKEQFAEAKLTGSLLGTDDAKKATEAWKQYNMLMAAFKNTLLSVGYALIQLKDDNKDTVKIVLEVLQGIRQFIRENKTLVATIAGVGIGLVVVGAGLAGFGLAMSAVITGAGILIGILKGGLLAAFAVLTSPLTLIAALIAGVTVAIVLFVDKNRTMGAEFSAMWTGMLGTFKRTFGGILDALRKGDFAAAGEIAWTGLKAVWQEGIVFLTKQWIKFKGFFVDGWHDMLYLVKGLFMEFSAWIGKTMFKTLGSIVSAINSVSDSLGLGLKSSLDKDFEKMAKDVEKGKDLVMNEMTKEAQKDQAARDKAREGELQGELDKLNELKAKLGGLVAGAAPKPEEPKTPDKELAKQRKLLDKLGDATRGAFRVANARQSLGIGPANDAAKKAYEVQKNMLAELRRIRVETEKFD
jgi:hypothetical protein